jgi:hypothetical protein
MRAYLYPFLFVVAPVLALAGENLDQGIGPSEIVTPLILSTLAFAVALVVGTISARTVDRQGLIAFVLLLGFSAFGFIYGALPAPAPADRPRRMIEILAVLLALSICAAILITRVKKSLEGLTRFLFAMGAILVFLFGGRLALAWLTRPETTAEAAGPLRAAQHETSGGPDIWLIVLDAYTGEETLESVYGMDNRPFLDSLRARGFQVPLRARANYVKTFQSLAAMLDWEYLDWTTDDLGARSANRQPVYDRLKNNRTARELRERGYEIVFFRSSYPPLSSNEFADIQIPRRLAGEFSRYWLSTTLLYPIVTIGCYVTRCRDGAWPFLPESLTDIEDRIRGMVELAGAPGSRFVFAHFLLPHGPFRLDADCRPIDPLWPTFEDPSEEQIVLRLYADQVRCANRQLLELVDGILDRSSEPPVILLQGDHGYGRFPLGQPLPLEQSRPDQIKDRVEVLSAYYVPDGEPDLFWNGITPVNVFRVLFGELFGFELETLPDSSYWSDWDRPYLYTPVD